MSEYADALRLVIKEKRKKLREYDEQRSEAQRRRNEAQYDYDRFYTMASRLSSEVDELEKELQEEEANSADSTGRD